MCQNQQLMRIDNEKGYRSGMHENFIWRNIVNPARRSDAIIISDYNKGLIDHWTPDLIKDAIKNKIPVFVDPKNDNYNLYRGATCITPNLKEFTRIMTKMKGYDQDYLTSGIIFFTVASNLLPSNVSEPVLKQE